jgi:hypothetical protein
MLVTRDGNSSFAAGRPESPAIVRTPHGENESYLTKKALHALRRLLFLGPFSDNPARLYAQRDIALVDNHAVRDWAPYLKHAQKTPYKSNNQKSRSRGQSAIRFKKIHKQPLLCAEKYFPQC